MKSQKSIFRIVLELFFATLLYLINVPGLVMNILIRYRIGTDSFASWSWKHHGLAEGQRAPSFVTPYWTLLLAYIWIRSFMLVNVVSQSAQFNAELGSEWVSLFPLYLPWRTGGPEIWSTGVGSDFFWWFSLVIPIVGVIQLIVFEYVPKEGENTDMESLGRSIPFMWLAKPKKHNTHTRRKNIIRLILDPALVAVIGAIFYYFRFPVHAWFFWISALSILFVSGFQVGKRWWITRQAAQDGKAKNETKRIINTGTTRRPPTAG